MSPTGRNPQPPVTQILPLRTELGRKLQEAFREETPKVWIQTDYSSIEFRLLAELLAGPLV